MTKSIQTPGGQEVQWLPRRHLVATLSFVVALGLGALLGTNLSPAHADVVFQCEPTNDFCLECDPLTDCGPTNPPPCDELGWCDPTFDDDCFDDHPIAPYGFCDADIDIWEESPQPT